MNGAAWRMLIAGLITIVIVFVVMGACDVQLPDPLQTPAP